MSRPGTLFVAIALAVLLAASGIPPASGQGRPGVDFRDVPEVSSKRLSEVTTALINAIGVADSAAVQAFTAAYTTPEYQAGGSIEARLTQFRTARWRLGNVRLRGERFWKGVAAGTYTPIVQDETTGTWWNLELATVGDDDLRVRSFT